jgi:glycosyltransferase involved in cell wall biosynthesis
METTTHHLPLKSASDATHGALLYVLHSGKLFGTERMAISTLIQLGVDFESVLLAPPGAAVEYALTQGIKALTFAGIWELSKKMLALFLNERRITLVATGLTHSLIGIVLAGLLGVRLRHIHIVHGGTDERLSYGRKKWLRWFAIDFVAVSDFVRERLIVHGVPAKKIQVIENFLTQSEMPLRAQFDAPVKHAVLISRLDPIKRVDLLLDAFLAAPALSDLDVIVLGSGWDLDCLRARSEKHNLPLRFVGFCDTVPDALVQADLLIHTCPEEPFGLVVLEAIAAGVPVLVPDTGGPSGFICDGVNGFLYRANDAAHLADRLLEIRQLNATQLNQIVAAARSMLCQRFSVANRLEDYRRVLSGGRT